MMHSNRIQSWLVNHKPPKRSPVGRAFSNDAIHFDLMCAACGSYEWVRHERRYGFVPFCGDCIEDATHIPPYSELGVGD